MGFNTDEAGGYMKLNLKLPRIPELKIGKLVARIPIIQGGMGVGISLSGLASAVAREGGIGVIATAGIGMLERDFQSNFKAANERALRREIRQARKKTDGIIGVNIMLALSDYAELCRAAIEEGVDLVVLSAGLPLKVPDHMPPDWPRGCGSMIVPKVSSGRAARLIFQYWARHYDRVPDAVVLEGPMAGGHQGYSKEDLINPDFEVETLVPDVIAAVRPFEQRYGQQIPVIVGGGIFTGADIHRFLEMGVQGVMMGTRFVATYECDAHERFKEAYLNCRKEDMVVIDSPVGLPGRAILNKYLSDVTQGIRKPYKCFWKCLRTCDVQNAPYCIADALTNAKKGLLEKGFAFAGANAYRVNKVVSVKNLIELLVREYRCAAATLQPVHA
jgi:NAD(P)H-dependent flavin oxidoreductase YrpB (nitropropane dioxygenase family)